MHRPFSANTSRKFLPLIAMGITQSFALGYWLAGNWVLAGWIVVMFSTNGSGISALVAVFLQRYD